jgi:hypothetical protein
MTKNENIDVYIYLSALESHNVNYTTSKLIATNPSPNADPIILDHTLKYIIIAIPKKGETKTEIEFEYWVKGGLNPGWYRWYMMNFTGSTKQVWVGVFVLLMMCCYACLLCCGTCCFIYKRYCKKIDLVIQNNEKVY